MFVVSLGHCVGVAMPETLHETVASHAGHAAAVLTKEPDMGATSVQL